MSTFAAAPSQQHTSSADTTEEMLGSHFDELAERDYLKDDQSSHRRYHHRYEDLLM